MRRLLACLALALAPRLLPAQILTLPSNATEPQNFLGGGVAFLNAVGLRDDDRKAYWNVNSVTAYRVVIDRATGGGTSLGAAITWSTPDMVISTGTTGACPATCKATASFQHYQLTYRSAGTGRGAFNVAELSAGGLRVGDVRAGGTQVAPDRTMFTASAGFGFAFQAGSGFAAEIVQEYHAIFAGGGFSGAAGQWGTRLGVRFGFGS